MDVAEALDADPRHLDEQRAGDAIAEALTFALPLAGDMTREPDGRIVVESSCLLAPVSAGAGVRQPQSPESRTRFWTPYGADIATEYAWPVILI